MIKIVNVNGRYAPRIYCDHCGTQVTDAGNANVIYHDDVVDGGTSRFSHVHKGECDQRMTAKHGDDGGTDELRPHMAFLLSNVGMDQKTVEKAFDTAAMLSSI